MPPKRKQGNTSGPKAKRKPRNVKQEKVEEQEEDDDSMDNITKDSLMISKPKFTCAKCNKKYKYEYSYKQHLRNEHSKLRDALRCPECPARCPNQETLNLHTDKVHKREIYTCPKCNKEFARHAHVLRHIAQTGCTGEDINMFPCEICKAEFTRKDNLMVHLRMQHITRKHFGCKLCAYSTRSFNKHVAHYLAEHMDGKITYDCDVCGNSTGSRAAMTKHLEIHGEKKYSCDVCNYSTYTVEVIRRHVLTHVDNKPYQCTLCPASFIQMAQLRRHRLRHDNCCDVCNRGFQDKKTLAVHMASHQPYNEDGTVDVQCPAPECRQMFDTKKLLTKHLKLDHDERPFECEVCNKRYRKESELKKHVTSHTLERPRRCMYCVNARAYVRGLALVQHVRKAHPNVFKDHLNHVRAVLGTVNKAVRVTKSELDSILNVLDAEAERIIDGYGEGVLYGGMQEVEADTSATSSPIKVTASSSPIKVIAVKQEHVKNEDKPLMSEADLGVSLGQLLSQLIDKDTLQDFGWPHQTVDVVLEKVIEQCGAKPADRDKYTSWQRLRENAKQLLLYVVEDKHVVRMLETHTIDQIVKYILAKVTDVDLDGDLDQEQGDLDQDQEHGDLDQEQGDLGQGQDDLYQGDLDQDQDPLAQDEDPLYQDQEQDVLDPDQSNLYQGDLDQEQGDFDQDQEQCDVDQDQEQCDFAQDQDDLEQDQKLADLDLRYSKPEDQEDKGEAGEGDEVIEVPIVGFAHVMDQNQERGALHQEDLYQGDLDQDRKQGDLGHDQKQGDLELGDSKPRDEAREGVEIPIVAYAHILG